MIKDQDSLSILWMQLQARADKDRGLGDIIRAADEILDALGENNQSEHIKAPYSSAIPVTGTAIWK